MKTNVAKLKTGMRGACSAYGGGERVLVGKPEGKRLFGRTMRIEKNNIKMDRQEVGCGGTWTGSSWLRIGTGGRHLLMW